MKFKPIYGLLLVCIIIADPLFAFLDFVPIRLWDESRLAINAFEMYHSGNWLVPTYKGEPDFWNAKPPMMIWLQVIFMKVIGMNELAVRLPSAIAAAITCLSIYWFFAKKYDKPLLGILASTVLVTCAGYVRLHGTRTGDYDSLLVMFTTLFSLSYFLYLQENKTKYLYMAVIFLTAGTLTKGIAPLIFLPGVLIATIIEKKLLRVIRSPHLYIGLGIYIVFAIGYYILREQYNPGYIANVNDNEISGRFFRKDGNVENNNIWYYYDFLLGKTFRDWYKVLVIGIIVGLFTRDIFLRKITIYSLVLGGIYFIIVSRSGAKAEWYDMASYPFFSIITAVGIYIVFNSLRRFITERYYLNSIIPVLLVVLLFIQPMTNMVRAARNPEIGEWSFESHNITLFLKNILHKKHDGNGMTLSYSGYNADIDWYLNVLNKEKRAIPVVDNQNLQAGQKVIAFQGPEKNHIESHYNFSVLETFHNVTVYSINGKK